MVRVLFKDGPLPPEGRDVASPCDKISNSESVISPISKPVKSQQDTHGTKARAIC
jgi:hypothetical protein